MRVHASDAAVETIGVVRSSGRTDLVMVLSNGCCDATAPYLYDAYVPDPDCEDVGEIDGVPVLAPRWLTRMYPNDEMVIDVDLDVLDDSMSLETEHDRRFILRLPVTRDLR